MNLAERRAVHEFQTQQFPELQKKIEEAAGYELPVEVDWDSLAVPQESKLYGSAWPKVYFEPLIAALQEVGRDHIGKHAMKEKLNKVVVRNTLGCYYADRWASFEDGVLTLDHESVQNVEEVEARQNALIALLEDKL
ncbi:MAG: hypothetical protein JO022_17020 [Acidobacteriaceae bacterium]|nr:hypothetical protein [Acidobacteriaceae bacterium]